MKIHRLLIYYNHKYNSSRRKGSVKKRQSKDHTNLEHGNKRASGKHGENSNIERAFHSEMKILWYMAQSEKHR